MLTYAYNHIGGQNLPIVLATIPTSPTTGYSEINVNTFVDNLSRPLFTVAKVRFYCETALHARKIHFYTPNAIVAQMTYNGGTTGNTASVWKTGFTKYADHTAFLPAATDSVYGTLTNFPFLSGTSYYWCIAGFGSNYRCDDVAAGATYTTLHQIWVNTGKYSSYFIQSYNTWNIYFI
jgi:hypothetical protein